ncbi:MAG TPA: GGDEF domain-containing protein [Burkholderiales bacterium]|nr:GGDEF domain-containing protein [Burkholderiales bacterium]
MREFYSVLRPAWVPLAILAGTALAVAVAPPLPASLAGLRNAGPYTVLITGTLLAWWFNRGRAFVILASLLAAFAAYELYPTKAVYTALVVIVPFNALLAMIRPERGARYRMAYRWLVLLAGECLLVAWIASAGKSPLSGTWWNWLLDTWLLRSPPTPLVGRLMFAAAFVAAVTHAYPDHTPVQVGNAGALAAFFIAAEFVGLPSIYAAFMTAAAGILVVAMLQESQHLALRDPLTGLPGRRALEERLRSLGERYAVAMVDVDHFKQFNDTHGHDVGDQVLKLVGAKLSQVGGGGIVYRYGGEEFSVLFPYRDLAEVLPRLEAIRGTIEDYQMAIRGEDRPKKAEEGAKRRGGGLPDKVLSVTVSIGAAGPSAEAHTPHSVIKAADEALYRAKKAGRNRVSK